MKNSVIKHLLDKAKETVDLSSRLIDDSDVKEIVDELNSNYPDIKVLNLAHNPIGDSSLEYLAKLKNIEKVDLTQTSIKGEGEGLIELLKSKKINTLILDNCDLPVSARDYIEKAQSNGKDIHYSLCTFYKSSSFGHN